MDARILILYKAKCEEYGWQLSYRGLREFERQIKDGVRDAGGNFEKCMSTDAAQEDNANSGRLRG